MNNSKKKILNTINSLLKVNSKSHSVNTNNDINKSKITIIILGFGVEGKSTFEFLVNNFQDLSHDYNNDKTFLFEFVIADKRDKNDLINSSKLLTISSNNDDGIKYRITFLTGDSFTDFLTENLDLAFDLIVKSPGISLSESFIKKNRDKISSQIDIFLQTFPNQTIGITGTKGKSTTATLTHEMLLNQGRKSILAGNIGKAVFDIIDDITDEKIIIVLELSCHQLQLINVAPKVSVLLNIYPEHLDYYNTFENYKLAKYNIIAKQDDNGVYIFPAKEFDQSELETLSTVTKNNTPVSYDFDIDYNSKKVSIAKDFLSLDLAKVKLPGEHNFFNISASILAVREVVVNQTDDLDIVKLKESIYNFTGLEHRLEFVGNFKGIDFYNDSISTIPQTTIAALRTFNNEVDTLILGGMNRSDEIKFDELAKEISNSKIRNIFFMPDTGKVIFDELLKIGFSKRAENQLVNISNKSVITFYFSEDLEEIVSKVFRISNILDNSICLLSPAASSYNLFNNFEDRGKKFKEFVRIYVECGMNRYRS